MRTGKRPDAGDARFRVLVESAPDGIVIVDREGRIVLVNAETERLSGYGRDELLGRPVEALIPEHLRAGHIAHRATYHADPRTRPMGAGVSLSVRRKDGSEFPAEISLSPVTTEEGLFVIAVVRDVTEQRRAEAERARLIREQAARAEAEAAARRAAILARAGAVLAASLDYPATLAAIARLAVPDLADCCVVDLLEPDGSLRCVGAEHMDPAKTWLVQELRRRVPPDPGGSHPAAEAIRTGRSELVADLHGRILAAATPGPEHLDLVRRLGPRSALVVPLVARGRALGVVSFVLTDPERRLEPADVTLAEEIVRRAALAVDNARLYREARRAEAELRHQLDFTQALTESLGEGLYALDPEGCVTFLNPAAEAMLGWTRADLLGRNVHGVIHPQRADGTRVPAGDCPLLGTIRTGTTWRSDDEVFTRKDGSLLPVAVTASPITSRGEVAGAVVAFRDTTERKLAEAALRESEARFRIMADTAPVFLWTSGPEAEYTFFNRSWLDFTGRAMDEEVGGGWLAGVHPEDRVRCRDAHAEAARDRCPFTREYRLRRADGEYRWILDTASPRFEPDGRFAGHIGSGVDLTARKRAEEALACQAEELARLGETARTREAFIRSVVESLRDGLVVLDREGRVAAWNRAMEARYDVPASEVLGRPLLDLFPAFGQEGLAEPIERLLAGELDGFTLEATRHETLRKGRVVLNVKGSRLGDPAAPSGAVLLVEDVTERVALERAARQADKMAALGTLSAGITHEFNNPIGIMCSRIELMLEDADRRGLPADIRDDLEVLHRNARRVARIAQGLLSFARQPGDGRAPVALNQVVEETLLLVEKPMTKEGIRVVTDLAASLPPVHGDANALQQVVLNLLANAREAVPPGGEVRIGTTLDPDRPGWVRVTVADDGPGIPPEVLPRVFDPFFTTKTSGTGLGLSVSYGIVKDHGGVITVDSEMGAGTTFTLSLPAAARDA